MKLFRWAISAALAVGIAAGLSATSAGALDRTPSLSSLIVPPPHGFHSNPIDATNKVRTGSITFLQAVLPGCDLPITAQSQWLGTELRFYASARVSGDLEVCVTHLSSELTAKTVESQEASSLNWLRSTSHGRAGRLAVMAVPHATGITYSGGISGYWIDFARGPYVVSVTGSGTARTLAPSLARQQYARLTGPSVRPGPTPPLITITKCGEPGRPPC